MMQMKQMMQEANKAHEANEANEADVFPTSGRKAELGLTKKQATRKS